MDSHRADIIKRAINLETILSALITAHYFPGRKGVHWEFFSTVLHDQYASFAFKVSVFSKCYPSVNKKHIERIRRMANIRNLFAHCGTMVHKAADPDQIGVIDPKRPKEFLDFDELHEEFLRLEKTVLTEITPLLDAADLDLADSPPETK